MRSLLILLALVAAPVLAQDTKPDSSESASRFSVAPHAGIFVNGSTPSAGHAGVTGAYRISPETALTLSVTGGDLGPDRGVFASFGPGVSFARALDDRPTWTAQSGIRFTGSESPVTGRLPYRGTTAFGALAVDRAIPLVGSFEIVPTLGAYATGGHWVQRVGVAGDSLGGAFTSAGLLAGARVRFSALGRTWEVPLLVPVEMFGHGRSALPAYAAAPSQGVNYLGETYVNLQAVLDANPNLLTFDGM